MGIGHLGENLIFLISQPRAGSTMLQRILGNHPQIHTLSEPWIMLHPIYALREDGLWFDYDGRVARLARIDFFQSLPNDENDYFEALRRMTVYLYNQALISSEKHYILDKTPRYYHIIPELHRLFPNAHFIFLLRNPLAVMISIIRTWTRDQWLLLHRNKLDLVKAPRLILEGIDRLKDSCTVIHYEHFINNPINETKRICSDLGVDFVSEIVEYGSFDEVLWLHGDKSTIQQHFKPDPDNADRWVESTENPQIWRLAKDYLSLLGDNTVNRMGYSFGSLQEKLDVHKPISFRLWFTYPMWFLLNGLDWTERCNILERRLDRVIELLGDIGIINTFREIANELKKTNNTES